MSPITVLVLLFLALGAADYMLGYRFGIGREFEKGILLLGPMALSMIGMIVISPWIAAGLSPAFEAIYAAIGMDPSILPAMLFANDMGGAHLAVEVAKDPALGLFNGLVVSSMMGATISFTVPISLQLVGHEHTRELAFGLLSGVVTIPVGCLVAGLLCGIPFLTLCYDLLPLVILAVGLALLLLLRPEVCVKIFYALATAIRVLVAIGLVLGAVNFLAKREVVPGLGSVEEGVIICANACLVMAGMFPLIFIASRLLRRPFDRLGHRIGMNSTSMTGLLSTLATNVTTFGMMNGMDKKGITVNAAFAVSAAFSFAGHLAFTMAFDSAYLLPVLVGKLTAGALALALSLFLYGLMQKKQSPEL